MAGAGVVLTTPTSASAAGAPIVVATEAPVQSPLGSLPQIFSGVKAAARAINKGGGIQGRKVQVITCDTQTNPNREVSCATEAAAAGAVAMVGNFPALNPAGVENALTTAGVADLAGVADTPAQYSAPVAFPLGFFAGEGTACATKGLSSVLKKSVSVASVAEQVPGGVNQAQVIAHSASQQPKNKVTYAGSVPAGFTTTDFAPVVAQVKALNPNVVFTIVIPPQVVEFITAAKAAGQTWALCSNDGALTASQLVQLGSSAPTAFTGSITPPLSAAKQYPELKTFMSQMKAELASGDSSASLSAAGYNSVGLNAWLGMQVFAQVAKSIKGTIDHNSFLAALKHTKVNLGVIPPINFASPIGSGSYPRVFNDTIYLLQWNASQKQFVLQTKGTVINAFATSGLGA
jgi:ABC-type branched-subunit amino acid transport system substrate-binding protein